MLQQKTELKKEFERREDRLKKKEREETEKQKMTEIQKRLEEQKQKVGLLSKSTKCSTNGPVECMRCVWLVSFRSLMNSILVLTKIAVLRQL